MTGDLCWCCAQWGLSRPAPVKDQGGGTVCVRCSESSPSACKQRHIGEALRAGKTAATTSPRTRGTA